jgi:hypothetical protein
MFAACATYRLAGGMNGLNEAIAGDARAQTPRSHIVRCLIACDAEGSEPALEERVERRLRMSAGRAIVHILRAEGVRAVFGIPGGHVLAIYEGLCDTPEVRHVLVRHEHAAAAMAAGYAQLTGEPGVCVATAGPGATNLLTAVAEAHVGSLPMIVLSGRGMTATAHRGASQEVPTERVFAPVTKCVIFRSKRHGFHSAVRRGRRCWGPC